MKTKLFEVRDRATCIPVMATKPSAHNESERFLLARAGYGTDPTRQNEYVILSRIAGGGGVSTCDPYDWGDRTMSTAHHHIIEHFDVLKSGAVVDVQFIRGETSEPAQSEMELYQ